MIIAIPVLNRCLKLNLYRVRRSVKMTPTASRLLDFLIDDRSAAYWSLARYAIALGVHPRTVDDAIAELKLLGFITVFYRRRQTSVKVLCVDAILSAVSRAVAIAKQRAKAAIALLRRGFQASGQSAPSIHFGYEKRALTDVERRVRKRVAASLRVCGRIPVPR